VMDGWVWVQVMDMGYDGLWERGVWVFVAACV
jgi:hypothetical protein